MRKPMKPRLAGDPVRSHHKVDTGRKKPSYQTTRLTVKERIDLISDVDTAIKSHCVTALPGLILRCVEVANGEALIKRLREALE